MTRCRDSHIYDVYGNKIPIHLIEIPAEGDESDEFYAGKKRPAELRRMLQAVGRTDAVVTCDDGSTVRTVIDHRTAYGRRGRNLASPDAPVELKKLNVRERIRSSGDQPNLTGPVAALLAGLPAAEKAAMLKRGGLLLEAIEADPRAASALVDGTHDSYLALYDVLITRRRQHVQMRRKMVDADSGDISYRYEMVDRIDPMYRRDEDAVRQSRWAGYGHWHQPAWVDRALGYAAVCSGPESCGHLLKDCPDLSVYTHPVLNGLFSKAPLEDLAVFSADWDINTEFYRCEANLDIRFEYMDRRLETETSEALERFDAVKAARAQEYLDCQHGRLTREERSRARYWSPRFGPGFRMNRSWKQLPNGVYDEVAAYCRQQFGTGKFVHMEESDDNAVQPTPGYTARVVVDTPAAPPGYHWTVLVRCKDNGALSLKKQLTPASV